MPTRCGVFHSVALSSREHGSCSGTCCLKPHHTSSMQRDRAEQTTLLIRGGGEANCMFMDGCRVSGRGSSYTHPRVLITHCRFETNASLSNCYWINARKPQCRNSAPHVWATQRQCFPLSGINKTYKIIFTCQLCRIWLAQWPALVLHITYTKTRV